MVCDAKDCGFLMLNDDEIMTSVQEESNPVDDKMDDDEDKNNERRKVHQMLTRFQCWRQLLLRTLTPSNVYSYGVVRTPIRVLSYTTTAAQENDRPCSEKTKVYNEGLRLDWHHGKDGHCVCQRPPTHAQINYPEKYPLDVQERNPQQKWNNSVAALNSSFRNNFIDHRLQERLSERRIRISERRIRISERRIYTSGVIKALAE
ncbi:hypothetical protein TNCV_4805881 [Trichonephila clavipes]|nr:hypothetical protein TNCV_4805881 [Trichonephila clavipes]